MPILLHKITQGIIQRAAARSGAAAIELSDNSIIGRGSKRECHAHPTDTNLCVMVARAPERINAQHPNIVEWLCSIRLDQRGAPFDHRFKCYGWTHTNRGLGLVIELVRDANGSPSQTVIKAIKNGNLKLKQMPRLLTDLQTWALNHDVTVHSPSKDNIVVRICNDQPTLVLIDGIGGSQLKWIVVLRIVSRWFACWKTLSKWTVREDTLLDALERECVTTIPRRLMPTRTNCTRLPAFAALKFAWRRKTYGN